MQNCGGWKLFITLAGMCSKLAYDMACFERSGGNKYCPRVLAYDVAGSTLRSGTKGGFKALSVDCNGVTRS